MKNKMWLVLVCLSVLIMGCSKKEPQQTDTGTPKQEMNSGGNTTPQTETVVFTLLELMNMIS